MSRTASTVLVTANIPPELYDTLVAVARAEGRTRTQVIIRALERYHWDELSVAEQMDQLRQSAER